jgi:hypothetical protein
MVSFFAAFATKTQGGRIKESSMKLLNLSEVFGANGFEPSTSCSRKRR